MLNPKQTRKFASDLLSPMFSCIGTSLLVEPFLPMLISDPEFRLGPHLFQTDDLGAFNCLDREHGYDLRNGDPKARALGSWKGNVKIAYHILLA